MWNRKELKKKAKHSLKLNYIACIAVCFIMVFIVGKYQSTVQFILKYDTRNVANLKYDAEQKAQIIMEIEKLCDGDLKAVDEQRLENAVDKISKKYNIKNKSILKTWVNIYNKKGVSALNFKEVTFFGIAGETSNWNTITKTLKMLGSDRVQIEKNINLTEEQISYFFDMATKPITSEIGIACYLVRLFANIEILRTLIYLCCAFLSLLLAIFVAAPLTVGEKRFFLENRTYHGTKIGRIGYLFKERCFQPTLIMLMRNIFMFLWALTIVGGIIKSYEYEMIPFIIAENPKIDRKKAFSLSKQMMKGNKWRSFLVDISFWPWLIVTALVSAGIAVIFFGIAFEVVLTAEICCGILMALFLNPYKTATKTELYIALRKEAVNNDYEFCEELCDEYIDLDLLEERLNRLSQIAETSPASGQ